MDMTGLDEKRELPSLKQELHTKKVELEAYKEKIVHNNWLKDLNVKRLSIIERMKPIVVNGSVKINPDYEFEKNEEYISLKKELEDLEYGKKIKELKSNIDELDATTKHAEENVKLLSDRVVVLGELVERKENE